MVTVVTISSPSMSSQKQEEKAFEECRRVAQFLEKNYFEFQKDPKPSVRIMCSYTQGEKP